MSNSRDVVLKGLFWSYAERMSAQIVSVLVSIILARLLTPEHFGIIAIVMIFITFCDAVVNGGLGNAIVQKQNADELDVNTMLACSIALSAFLYTIIFLVAPLISNFFEVSVITPILRILGLRLLVSGVNSIQRAWTQKKMQFRKFFYSTFIGTIISAVVGITMAYMEYGVWALVAQYLTYSIISTIVLFFIDDWIPKFQFSYRRAKSMLDYGWKVLASTIIYTIEGEMRSILIGKKFSPSSLAYYDQGKKFPNLLSVNINTSISNVLFPMLSDTQQDLENLKRICRRSIKIGMYILTPVLVGLICVADDFVIAVYTEKWTPAIPFLVILAISYLTRPFATTCNQAIMSIGRSDISLKIIVILNVVDFLLISSAIFIFPNIYWVAITAIITEIIGLICFSYYQMRLIGYTYVEQLRDVLPSLLTSFLMGCIIRLLHFLPINSFIVLLLQALLGLTLYLLFSLVARLDPFVYILRNAQKKLGWNCLKYISNKINDV